MYIKHSESYFLQMFIQCQRHRVHATVPVMSTRQLLANRNPRCIQRMAVPLHSTPRPLHSDACGFIKGSIRSSAQLICPILARIRPCSPQFLILRHVGCLLFLHARESAPLLLIRYPRCGQAVVRTYVVRRDGENRGCRFYKCPNCVSFVTIWFKYRRPFLLIFDALFLCFFHPVQLLGVTRTTLSYCVICRQRDVKAELLGVLICLHFQLTTMALVLIKPC